MQVAQRELQGQLQVRYWAFEELETAADPEKRKCWPHPEHYWAGRCTHPD